MSSFPPLRDTLVATVLKGEGRAPKEQRRAAFDDENLVAVKFSFARSSAANPTASHGTNRR
jgi:hypothetical protein